MATNKRPGSESDDHGIEDDSEGVFPCDVCPKTFYKVIEYTEHLKNHFKGETFMCASCGQSFSTQKELSVHEVTHELDDDLKFECSICKLRFPTCIALEDHAASHVDEPQCEICTNVFKLKIQLRKHQLEYQKKNKCCACEKTFSSEVKFRNHVDKSHVPLKAKIVKFQCKVCQKFFTTKHNLMQHFETHEEKKYKCDVCGTTYRVCFFLVTARDNKCSL